MRKEFNELVDRLKFFDLFQKGDEVDIALTNLSNKIDEVEKRIECAVRSAKEIKESICKYTEDVDYRRPINMSVNDHDFILNRTNDVDIALALGDNMCVVDNWYNLFEPKVEPKPIAVGNIEYDFPEEVYTIGNADNSEIIGDVYESVFIAMLDLGVIITVNDNRFQFGKANYIVSDNNFINLIKEKQIDLSKVPIKKEVFMTFHSSWGEIDCDKDGNVIEVRGDEYIGDERNYLFDIDRFDLVEFGKFCESKNITMCEAEDIMSVGFWKHDGTYNEAEKDWRKNIFGDNEEQVDDVPSMQCRNTHTFDKVKEVIAILKTLDNGDCVDGETMEYILRQVGMDDQMLKQLFPLVNNDELDELLDIRNEYHSAMMIK